MLQEDADMAEQPQGMSIGAKSLESDDNVDFAARTMWRMYAEGHRTILPFAEGAEIPDEWGAVVVPWPTVRARRRPMRATRSDNPPTPTGTSAGTPAKTGWPPTQRLQMP